MCTGLREDSDSEKTGSFTLEPLAPPSWSLSLSPHTYTRLGGSDASAGPGPTTPHSARLQSLAWESVAKKEKDLGMGSSTTRRRPTTHSARTLQSMPPLRHCLMATSMHG